MGGRVRESAVIEVDCAANITVADISEPNDEPLTSIRLDDHCDRTTLDADELDALLAVLWRASGRGDFPH